MGLSLALILSLFSASFAVQTPGSLKDWCVRSQPDASTPTVVRFPINFHRQRERIDRLISQLKSETEDPGVEERDVVQTLATLKSLVEGLPYNSSYDRHLLFNTISGFSSLSQRTSSNLIRAAAIQNLRDLLENQALFYRYVSLDLRFSAFNSYRFPFQVLTRFALTSFARALQGSWMSRTVTAPPDIQRIAIDGLVALAGEIFQAGVFVDRFYDVPFRGKHDYVSTIRDKLQKATQNASDIKIRIYAKQALLRMPMPIPAHHTRDKISLTRYLEELIRE